MASDNTGRKRKRTNGSMTDVPSINGVPMDLTPYFVQALRTASKFFQHATDPHGKETSASSKTASSVFDSLMDRVAAATTMNSNNDEEKDRLNNMNNAIETWLNGVKRFAPRQQYSQAVNEERDKISVPYACFLYLWDLQQEHCRVAVRRAALFMSGILLQKSKDCRFHLEQDENLSSWVSSIVADGFAWKNPEQAAKQLPLLQREAAMLLSNLVDQGYGNLYPKIGVAVQRIRQQCPNLESAEQTMISHMSELRIVRDIALTHSEQEIRRVEKLIARSHACLEILVPRVGKTANFCDEEEGKAKAKSDFLDGDEDDIDWEDGDDFEDGSSFIPSNAEHLAAVERTLAVMESTGGLRGGEMEVDFGKPDTGDDRENAQQHEKTFSAFKKCVKLLAGRHLPRLSLWLDGLINADGLILKSSTLISLSSDVARMRNHLVEKLSELKQEVSSILSSASRLNVEPREGENQSSSFSSTHLDAPRLGLNSERTSLASALKKKRKSKNKNPRSNRIQIKCRSN